MIDKEKISRWRSSRWFVPGAIVAAIAILAPGGWYFFVRQDAAAPAAKDATSKDAKSGKAGKGGGMDPNRAQPVAAAAARTGDINLIQTALGTVTALRTVTVKPRVDGLLQSLAFKEGTLVHAGDALAQIDPAPFQVALDQAEGTLARDAAQLANARIDLERYRKLATQDSISQQQVDQQAAMVRQLEGTVKISQAQVDNAKLQLSYTRITAPLGGRLGLIQVDAGNMVHGSDANGIAVITQVDPISVVFTIPQDTLPRVLARLSAGDRPPVDAWDRENKSLLSKGTLVTTDNQIDVTTGTVRLKATFANGDGKLFPNQFVNVRMVVDTHKDAVLVPPAAVQRGAQGTVVYVVKEDGTVQLRAITTGATDGPATEVITGLKAGERVITDGVDRIREGAKVEVTEAGGGGAGRTRDPSNMDPAKREAWKKAREGKAAQ
jgi:multidrug efflux system membrane fusion protein